MRFVVDASVAAQWFLQEPDSAAARQILLQRHKVIAPELVLVEIANVLFKALMRGELSEADAQGVAADMRQPWDMLVPDGALVDRATTLSLSYRHPIYDCLYLALAEREKVPVLTIDKKLLSVFGQRHEFKLIHLRDL